MLQNKSLAATNDYFCCQLIYWLSFWLVTMILFIFSTFLDFCLNCVILLAHIFFTALKFAFTEVTNLS